MKTMKAIVSLVLLGMSLSASAQITKEQLEERKEMKKMAKSELTAKSTKEARKEAKKLEKEGWQVSPGALPIEKQLDRVYQMQYEFDDDMLPKFIIGEAQSIGQNYDAAKMQALELAKQNLAGQIQTEITALVENQVENKQLDPEDAVSVVKSISNGKSLISQSIGRTLTVTEMYRTLKNKNKEVLVRIAYSSKLAKEAAKKAAQADLEREGNERRDKIDNAIGW